MKAVLLRTGSVPVQQPVYRTGSLKAALSRHASITITIFSGEGNGFSSPRASMHLEVSNNNSSSNNNNNRLRRDDGIRRILSESDVTRSGTRKLSGAGSLSLPPRVEEDDYTEENNGLNFVGIWQERGIPLQELGFSGGAGYKTDGYSGGCGGGSGGGDRNGGDKGKIGDYYKEMLKSNPGDSLLLRNYAKYLQEVERDMERAEEYYGRAILVNPGDGEVLSLYGKLIWETKRDESRAKSYFDQALAASPHDCMVLGSYAHFMWEVEEEEENDDDLEVDEAINNNMITVPAVVVAAL